MVRNIVLVFRAIADAWRERVDKAEVDRLGRMAEDDRAEQLRHPGVLGKIRAKRLAILDEATAIRERIGGES